ncbi:MAG: thiamine pyrophosphate-binding protein [Lachnoanaerobaculum sp.]|nr:thiamine pyrophosphate-binding protein [Lachnoanaerobaculum sp.]
MKIKLSNYIAKKLVELGINRGFSVTGGGAMHLNNGLGHQDGLTMIYNHHEQACAMAAEAYARINNQIAVVCVTTGPGGTNAITGVLGGWLDSIPMFILSGQVRYDWTARYSNVGIRAMGDQEFDICKSIECMTKYSEMVIEPMRIRYLIEKCMYLAMNGRPGPVWLDIPLDVQGAYIEEDELIGFDKESYEAGKDGWASDSPYKTDIDEKTKLNLKDIVEPVPDEVLKEIIEKIKSSKRPVFNAGNGIRIGNAHKEFLELIELLNIPVVVGWNSEDCLWVDHPLYAGRPGNFGDRPGNFTVQNSDLVLSVGSRLSLRQVGFNCKGWAREAFTIVNDIDKEELKKPTVHIDIPVHADCKVFMRQLIDMLKKEKTPVFEGGEGLKGMSWNETVKYWLKKYPVCRPEFLENDDSKKANVYAFIKDIGDSAKESQITVVGNGSACVVGGHSYIIKKGQRFISNSAVASMGYDLPAAIGAYMANLDGKVYEKELILITGDGSIQMNLQELQTIVHHKMDIKIFLINNEGYHSIRQTQNKFFGDEPLVGIGPDSGDLSFPDMEKLAGAYGITYFCAKTNSELEDAVSKTFKAVGPVICEAFVTKEQNFEPKSSGKQLADGRMVSPPLEDLTPFLSDEEMEENMIIPRMPE